MAAPLTTYTKEQCTFIWFLWSEDVTGVGIY